MRGLYAIVDLDALHRRPWAPLDFAQAVLRARPAALQLRAKTATPRDTLALLRQLVPACRRVGVPCFANDRPDLAQLAGCTGVHVGQADLSVSAVREITTSRPGFQVGISTHHIEQLQAALALGPDYVAFGPVFETQSKQRPGPALGLEALAAAHALSSAQGVPLVAIGGINLERASQLAAHAELGAVIGDLVQAGEALEAVTTRARRLHSALGAARSG